jgi:hypothetical protein
MRTTLDLPDDVANTLRMESARRGGRRKASLSILVSDAVRKAYGSAHLKASRRKIDLTAGRVVIGGVADAPLLTSDKINAALYDW